jgi:hypothetical protein
MTRLKVKRMFERFGHLTSLHEREKSTGSRQDITYKSAVHLHLMPRKDSCPGLYITWDCFGVVWTLFIHLVALNTTASPLSGARANPVSAFCRT